MLNLFARVRPTLLCLSLLVCVPSAFAAGPQAAKPAAATGTPAAPAAKAAPAPVSDANKLDLNTATADQLKALPGVGDAYTKRIIDGRPYTAKNQLTTRGILPQKTYDGIKDAIVARRPVKK